MKIIGIDPGSNCMGVAIWQGDHLLYTMAFEAESKDDWRRRNKFMVDRFVKLLKSQNDVDVMCIEEGVYRGHANHILQRLLGALEYMIPEHVELITVNQSSLKKFAGGGGSNKEQVARWLYDRMAHDENKEMLDCLIKHEKWDQTDAALVGFYAHCQIQARNKVS